MDTGAAFVDVSSSGVSRPFSPAPQMPCSMMSRYFLGRLMPFARSASISASDLATLNLRQPLGSSSGSALGLAARWGLGCAAEAPSSPPGGAPASGGGAMASGSAATAVASPALGRPMMPACSGKKSCRTCAPLDTFMCCASLTSVAAHFRKISMLRSRSAMAWICIRSTRSTQGVGLLGSAGGSAGGSAAKRAVYKAGGDERRYPSVPGPNTTNKFGLQAT
eukprot:358192-Chlamydomonas_euryale.AAC.24